MAAVDWPVAALFQTPAAGRYGLRVPTPRYSRSSSQQRYSRGNGCPSVHCSVAVMRTRPLRSVAKLGFRKIHGEIQSGRRQIGLYHR